MLWGDGEYQFKVFAAVQGAICGVFIRDAGQF